MSTSPDQFQEVLEIPEGINITMKKHMMQFQGPLGKTFKSFRKIPVNVQVNDGKITLNAQGKKKTRLFHITYCTLPNQKYF